MKYGFNARFDYSSALKGFAATLTDVQRTSLSADPAVAYVASDKPVSASGLVPVASGETVPPGIRRVGAATLTQAHQAANGAVAVIDSGVDLKNADLNAVKTDLVLAKGDRVVTTFKNTRRAPLPASHFEFQPPADAHVSRPLGK